MQSTSILARSCAACRRRKIRCDRRRPACEYCRRQGLTCVWPLPQRRPQRNDSSPTNRAASQTPAPDPCSATAITTQPFWAQVNAEAGSAEVTSTHQDQNGRDDVSSSRREDPEPTMLLLEAGSPSYNVQQYHPPQTDAFRLWQTFVDNVDPLIKIIHTPTVQSRFLQASVKLDGIEPSFEALMFAIYYAATISTQTGEFSKQSRANELGIYRSALNQALVRAGFFQRSRDIVSLQAFVTYLVCARLDNDSPCVWTLVSLAIRIGMRLALHQDKTAHEHSPYDTEMRRRLWWQICTLDVRTAEDEGTAPILSQAMLQVPLPINIADVDLHPEMGQVPKVNDRAIAMFYNNVRIEVTQGLRSILFTNESGSNVETTSKPRLQTRFDAVDSMENRLQSKYFDHCDSSIPLCSFTIITVRLVLLKARLTLHISHDNCPSEWCSEVDEFLFDTSVDLLERTHELATSRQYQRWWWLFRTYVEWDALALALRGLSRRPDRDNADRAWNAIDVAWSYAKTLATGLSYSQRWASLSRLKAKAHAADLQSRPHQQAHPAAPTTPQAFRQGQVESTTSGMLPPSTMCPNDFEPYGSMAAYWNLLDEDWSTACDASLGTTNILI